MIHIISTFYISKYFSELDNSRSKELEQALVNNLSSPFIEKIHLFLDDNDALIRLNELSNSDKIVIIEIGKKPKYSDFFNYIVNNVKDEICMITNADIFLYEMNDKLIENLQETKIAYALTRYEYDMTHPLIDYYQGSHDAYIFNSKFIDGTIINEDTNFYQNFPGIETHIIKALCDNGFKVYNPCRQIKIVHLHQTELRKYEGGWIGLHQCGDDNYFQKSCWCIPPIVIETTI
jgi:hypothetical protein